MSNFYTNVSQRTTLFCKTGHDSSEINVKGQNIRRERRKQLRSWRKKQKQDKVIKKLIRVSSLESVQLDSNLINTLVVSGSDVAEELWCRSESLKSCRERMINHNLRSSRILLIQWDLRILMRGMKEELPSGWTLFWHIVVESDKIILL